MTIGTLDEGYVDNSRTASFGGAVVAIVVVDAWVVVISSHS